MAQSCWRSTFWAVVKILSKHKKFKAEKIFVSGTKNTVLQDRSLDAPFLSSVLGILEPLICYNGY